MGEADPLCHIATYAIGIALKSLVNNFRTLIKDAVLQKIMLILDQGGLNATSATSRKKALLHWFKSTHPLSLNPDMHPVLIEALVKLVNGIMTLKAACPRSISLTKFIKNIIANCNATNPCQKPPFIING